MATSGTYTYAVSTADLSPVPGNTPFGYYDQDPSFQNVRKKLGLKIQLLFLLLIMVIQRLAYRIRVQKTSFVFLF